MPRDRLHDYRATVRWTGNLGDGTARYTGYSRDHEVLIDGKPPIAGSSDPAFRGDPARHNPEELLVAALSQCHMLWYLHLCSTAGVRVVAYEDAATGRMAEQAGGSGRFVEVVLRPRVVIDDEAARERALAAHDDAHRMCFLANSMNFPVRHEPAIAVSG
jgi:organic hydroperoxide reductase OsmC/OhrA